MIIVSPRNIYWWIFSVRFIKNVNSRKHLKRCFFVKITLGLYWMSSKSLQTNLLCDEKVFQNLYFLLHAVTLQNSTTASWINGKLKNLHARHIKGIIKVLHFFQKVFCQKCSIWFIKNTPLIFKEGKKCSQRKGLRLRPFEFFCELSHFSSDIALHKDQS